MAFETEYPDATWEAAVLMRRLEQVGELVSNRIAEVFRRYDLSHAAGNALAVIEGAGRPVAAGEVARAMHISSGSITSLIDGLERAGLVRRFTDPHDRRKVLVDVTPEAEGLLDEALPRVQVRARALAADLDPVDIATLLELLDRVAGTAAAVDDDADAPGGRKTPDRLRPPRLPDGRRSPPSTD